jgi:hypothetical protein
VCRLDGEVWCQQQPCKQQQQQLHSFQDDQCKGACLVWAGATENRFEQQRKGWEGAEGGREAAAQRGGSWEARRDLPFLTEEGEKVPHGTSDPPTLHGLAAACDCVQRAAAAAAAAGCALLLETV